MLTSFCYLQGNIVYRLIGVYPAEHFFMVDSETGEIKVNQSLRNDVLQLTEYSLHVEAYDSAYPLNKAREYITVSVNRNANPPAFGQNNYEKTISENFPLVSEVVTVGASDPDGGSRNYVQHRSNLFSVFQSPCSPLSILIV